MLSYKALSFSASELNENACFAMFLDDIGVFEELCPRVVTKS
jgi:hypothetical protein